MNASSLSSIATWIIESPWWATLLLKITLVLTVSWLLHTMLSTANPRWRVLLWRGAVSSLITVCALSLLHFERWVVPLELSVISAQLDPTTAVSAQPTSPDLKNTQDVLTVRKIIPNQSIDPLPEMASLEFSPPLDFNRETRTASLPDDRSGQWTTVAVLKIAAIVIWIVGIMISLLRFVAGRRRLASLIAASHDVPTWINQLASEISGSMNGPVTSIRSSTDVPSPIICRSSLGYTILIPRSLLESSSKSEMAAILTHEYSHLCGHDLIWNRLVQAVATLLWPHPLVWRMVPAHVSACEYAADAESARRLGDPAIYVQTLAKVALDANKTSAIPGLAMARVSNVRQRLIRVKETFRLPPLRRRCVWSTVLVMLAATAGLGAIQIVRAQSPETTTKPVARTLVVQISDESNQAIQNATLKATVYIKDVDYDSPDDAMVEPKALGNGRFEIEVADGAQAIQVRASAANRVPMAARWQGDEIDSDLPKEFTFNLPVGTKISGRVINEQGEPIDKANVYLLVITDKSTRQQVDLYRHLVTTDASGTWACEVMPAKFNGIWIRLTHPDYASDNMFGETAGQVSVDDVRSGRHSMVMKKGVTVQGNVVDSAGKPIAGATVYQGSDRFGSSYPDTKTDKEGHFKFFNSKLGEMVLTVLAKGHAPELKVIQVDAQTEPVAIVLPPGNALRIRTVDADGKPLGGVMIAPDTWREHRSLAIISPRESDAQGLFVWNDAPADEIKYSILKLGWMDHRDLAIKPQDGEIEIKMLKPLVVSGKVTEAATGRPIEQFSVVPGIKWKDNEIVRWERQDKVDGGDGKYVMKFSFPRDAHVLQIEAAGYEPVQSRSIQSNEGELSLDFELKPAKQITGFVLTPGGEPAVGADVVMALPNVYVSIFNGRMADARDQPFVITDQQGKFAFASQKEAFKLMVLHDSGVAILNGDHLQAEQSIKLRPWAKIAGTAKIGMQPAAQSELNLHYLDSTAYDGPRFSISGRARVDNQGRFEFVRVLPDAEFQVSRVIACSDAHGEVHTHSVNLSTQEGQTEQIEIGGTGRPLVGQLVVPETTAKYVWSFTSINGSPDEFEKPKGYEDWSVEEKTRWFNEWTKTPAGRSYTALTSRSYAIDPQSDGSFRIEDVPAGRYVAQGSIMEAPATKNAPFGESLGSFQQIFTVPEMEGGRSDEPLDIGKLTIKLRKFLKPGDAAPELQATTMDGKPISLADFAGKYVFLDFWATWCGPCIAEMPNLEKLHAKFGDRNDFVIIGVNMDATIDDAKKYLDEHPHPWTQTYIDETQSLDLQANFGIVGIPATFLIGPDGKVLGKDLRGDTLETQIEAHLP